MTQTYSAMISDIHGGQATQLEVGATRTGRRLTAWIVESCGPERSVREHDCRDLAGAERWITGQGVVLASGLRRIA